MTGESKVERADTIDDVIALLRVLARKREWVLTIESSREGYFVRHEEDEDEEPDA